MNLPNAIVLVSIDDLRYDALGVSGEDSWLESYDALATRNTPTTDAFAEQATTFTQATSVSSYTPPSHASMFTGQYPKTHGVKTFFNTYTGDTPTLAETLQDAGYETRAWVENQALEALNVTRGFDTVVCPFEDEDVNLFEFVEDASDTEEPVFLLVHLFDVHKPYCYTPGGEERHQYNEGYLDRMAEILPSEYQPAELLADARDEARDTLDNYDGLSESLREYAHNWSLDYLLREHLEDDYGEDRYEYLVKLYLAGIERFDEGRFNDLLDTVKGELDEEYALFVTSDHGEARCQWRDREDFMNSFNVSEQALRVPLFVESDCLDLPGECNTPTSHVDLAPTIRELVDAPDSQDLPGEPLWELPDEPADRALYHESWFYEGGVDFFGNVSETGTGGLSEVAIRRYPYKLTIAEADSGNPEIALYDLSEDPFERENRYGDEPAADLETQLREYLEGVDRTCTSDLEEDDDKLEDRLRALGYLE